MLRRFTDWLFHRDQHVCAYCGSMMELNSKDRPVCPACIGGSEHPRGILRP